jgi:hypothetical protein
MFSKVSSILSSLQGHVVNIGTMDDIKFQGVLSATSTSNTYQVKSPLIKMPEQCEGKEVSKNILGQDAISLDWENMISCEFELDLGVEVKHIDSEGH